MDSGDYDFRVFCPGKILRLGLKQKSLKIRDIFIPGILFSKNGETVVKKFQAVAAFEAFPDNRCGFLPFRTIQTRGLTLIDLIKEASEFSQIGHPETIIGLNEPGFPSRPVKQRGDDQSVIVRESKHAD